jgi:hypothetical protein
MSKNDGDGMSAKMKVYLRGVKRHKQSGETYWAFKERIRISNSKIHDLASLEFSKEEICKFLGIDMRFMEFCECAEPILFHDTQRVLSE